MPGTDYTGTAARFEVSYSQVYQWVRHYEECGEAGLEDRRGKRKSDDEVDELEWLRRENMRLKAMLQESERLNLLQKSEGIRRELKLGRGRKLSPAETDKVWYN